MPSFDIKSELDHHEVTNAVDQANREVGTRFDFKGIDAQFLLEKDKVTLKAEVDFQLDQMMEILRTKLAKRGVDVRHLEAGKPVIQMKTAVLEVTLKQGIPGDMAKNIVKAIKDQKLKVQTQIQGDKLRVTGKKRDDLQEVIAFLRKNEDITIPLQFDNFRD